MKRRPSHDDADLGNRPGLAALVLDREPCRRCGDLDELDRRGLCFDCDLAERMGAEPTAKETA